MLVTAAARLAKEEGLAAMIGPIVVAARVLTGVLASAAGAASMGTRFPLVQMTSLASVQAMAAAAAEEAQVPCMMARSAGPKGGAPGPAVVKGSTEMAAATAVATSASAGEVVVAMPTVMMASLVPAVGLVTQLGPVRMAPQQAAPRVA